MVDKEDDFARAIARGVTDYFQNKKPLPDVIDVHKTKSTAVGADKFSEHFAKSEFVRHCCGHGGDGGIGSHIV